MFNLSDKTFNTLSKIQKVLLVIMAIAAIITWISMIFTARALPDYNAKIRVYSFALTYLVFALAMICGFIYANKGYSKEAHNYYKAMMCFYALSALIMIITAIRTSGFGLGELVAIIKIVLLLILGFGKDLGKKNTWIIFYIVLAIELLFSPTIQLINQLSGEALLARIPSAIARLVIAGILGLCIEAKYRDKDARGTV